ncbi:MAG: SDR family oxidoreductase [Chloroflexota bacterium]|nr:MAG: SDR family oxidoreductase [Chloroflexota bacterium]
MKLEQKVAIVTGGGAGIGEGIVSRFAEEGASVVVCDIIEERARQVAAEVNSRGGKALAFKADVVRRDEVTALMTATIDTFGAVDILVNNAGVAKSAPFLEMSDEDWDYVVDVNLKGVFLCTQAALRHMMKRRYGKIVNISSIGGLGYIEVDHVNYPPSKAGVIALTQATAKVAGPYNVNVNSIAPGAILGTNIQEHNPQAADLIKQVIDMHVNASVLRRTGTREDIANLALFLASDESSFITAQVIKCDGGRTDLMW